MMTISDFTLRDLGKVFFTNEPDTRGTLFYGDLKLKRSDFYYLSDDEITEVALIPNTDSSDYSGSVTNMVNYDCLLERYPQIIQVYGVYNAQALAVTQAMLDANKNLLEDILKLIDYPIYDEDQHSIRMHCIYLDTFTETRQDFIYEIAECFDLSTNAIALLENATDDALITLFESMIPSGDYYQERNNTLELRYGYAVAEMSRDDIGQFLKAVKASK